jgi:hypothetical protein
MLLRFREVMNTSHVSIYISGIYGALFVARPSNISPICAFWMDFKWAKAAFIDNYDSCGRHMLHIKIFVFAIYLKHTALCRCTCALENTNKCIIATSVATFDRLATYFLITSSPSNVSLYIYKSVSSFQKVRTSSHLLFTVFNLTYNIDCYMKYDYSNAIWCNLLYL